MARDLSDPPAPDPDPGTEYAGRLRRLYETDVGRTTEFVLRNAIVISVACAVGWLADIGFAFVWLAVYLSTIAVYANYLRRHHRATRVTRRQWILVWAMGTAACATYTVLPLYLWTLHNPALDFVAASAIFGMAMLNLTRHTFDADLARVDLAVVCGAILFMGAVTMLDLGLGPQSGLVIAGTLASAIYYAFAYLDGLALRTRLLDKERREAQSAKMQAVGQLTTGIAHDFNNILTVVIGNIELARISRDRCEIEESLDDAHSAALRAGSLVSQLLAFSRRAQLRPVAIEPQGFGDAFARTMERLLPASITLRHHVAPGMAPLHCDRTLLETALMNLVINARDAMSGRGNLSIVVEECRLPMGLSQGDPGIAPGLYGRITVSDTGPGIPGNLLHRVAEPFFTTKSIGQGSGLGLAMVKGFSEQSGGGLDIASSPRGTDVALYLPLGQRDEAIARETVTGQGLTPTAG